MSHNRGAQSTQKRRLRWVGVGLTCCAVLSFSPGVVEAQPRIDVTPSSLEFGQVFLGESSSVTVEVANAGSDPLDVTGVDFGPATSGDFSKPALSLPITVPGGGRLVTEVMYTPSGRGSDSGSLVIESSDAERSVVTVPLSGRGDPAPIPEIQVTPEAVDFGGRPVGSTSAKTVTIRNVGFGPLTVTGLGLDQGIEENFQLTSGSLPIVLERDDDIQIKVFHTPLDEIEDFGRIVIESDDPDRPVVRVFLSGFGVSILGPEIRVSPLSLDFGDAPIGIPSARSVTIRNAGVSRLRVLRLDLGPDSSADFSITGRPVDLSLSLGEEVQVEVTYTPSGEGADTGTLRIQSDDPESPLVVVSFGGTGVPPVFRRADANIDGNVDLSDAISVLGQLFGDAPAARCLDASDANDDAMVDVSDAVFILVWLFVEGEMPAPGVEECGVDPTEDALEPCDYDACE